MVARVARRATEACARADAAASRGALFGERSRVEKAMKNPFLVSRSSHEHSGALVSPPGAFHTPRSPEGGRKICAILS
jgi:hypothetical protein